MLAGVLGLFVIFLLLYDLALGVPLMDGWMDHDVL